MEPSEKLIPGSNKWQSIFATARNYVYRNLQNSSDQDNDKIVSDVLIRKIGDKFKESNSTRFLIDALKYLKNHGNEALDAIKGVLHDGIRACYAMVNTLLEKNLDKARYGWNGDTFHERDGYWTLTQRYFSDERHVRNPGDPPDDYWENTPEGFTREEWDQVREAYEEKERKEKHADQIPITSAVDTQLLSHEEFENLMNRIEERKKKGEKVEYVESDQFYN